VEFCGVESITFRASTEDNEVDSAQILQWRGHTVQQC
jgi:hypothetical protein